jgi:hypothetical protein
MKIRYIALMLLSASMIGQTFSPTQYIAMLYSPSGIGNDWSAFMGSAGGSTFFSPNTYGALLTCSLNCTSPLTAQWVPWTGSGGTGSGVASINGTTGAFTFTGSGVSCATTTCTFTGSGGAAFTPTGFQFATSTTAARVATANDFATPIQTYLSSGTAKLVSNGTGPLSNTAVGTGQVSLLTSVNTSTAGTAFFNSAQAYIGSMGYADTGSTFYAGQFFHEFFGHSYCMALIARAVCNFGLSGTTGAATFTNSVSTPQIIASGGTPTLAPGTGAGTSPTCTAITGANMAGVISCTTGTATVASATLATVSFNGTLATAPAGCRIMPSNAATAAAQLTIYTTAPSTTAWTIGIGGTALTASTAYVWSYDCI